MKRRRKLDEDSACVLRNLEDVNLIQLQDDAMMRSILDLCLTPTFDSVQ